MSLSGCNFKKQNLEKNKLQKDRYTTIKVVTYHSKKW